VSTRLRLQLAAGALAVAVAAVVGTIVVVASTGGGGHRAPPATAGTPFTLVVPPDERAAVQVLTSSAVPRSPSLDTFLLIASLPVEPRVRTLEVPAPPPRLHRLHVAPTRLSLTNRTATVLPSDRPAAGSPKPVVPGALPDHFRFSYADDYHGWPTQPLHGLHVLHGGFNDPRLGGYHFGIDIAVDDSHPALEAPKGDSHRVFAVEGGVMHWARDNQTKICNARRFDIGHFAYWHVEPAVPYGTRVRAGQMVGWTCLNEWHVHLSEWARVNGKRRWVNPLHPGGKLAPVVDTAPPQIRAVYAYGPPSTTWRPNDASDLPNPDGAPELGLRDLHGAVDLRAWIDDGQGFLGVFAKQPDLASTTAPYKVWVQIRQVATHAIVWQRTVFQNDLFLSGVIPFFALYASGARPSLSDYQCLHSRIPCDGRLFYHLVVVGGRYLWDTRSVENGDYELTIRAYDIVGNVTTRVAALRVRN
jgi:hypothetical protein